MRLWLVAVAAWQAVAAAKCWFTLIQLIVSRLSPDLLLTGARQHKQFFKEMKHPIVVLIRDKASQTTQHHFIYFYIMS